MPTRGASPARTASCWTSTGLSAAAARAPPVRRRGAILVGPRLALCRLLSQPCEADERSARLTQPWHQLRLVVADGFTDFTRTQHEILGILAGRVEEILHLAAAGAGARGRAGELFDKPLRTLAELRRRHPAMTVEELPRPEPAQPGRPWPTWSGRFSAIPAMPSRPPTPRGWKSWRRPARRARSR